MGPRPRDELDVRRGPAAPVDCERSGGHGPHGTAPVEGIHESLHVVGASGAVRCPDRQ